jgi:hypothetical protein
MTVADLFRYKSNVGWFVLREKYCWLVADEPNEQGHMSHNDEIAQVGSIYRGLLPPPSCRRCFFPELPGIVRLERQRVVAKPPQTIEVKEEEKEGRGGGAGRCRPQVG